MFEYLANTSERAIIHHLSRDRKDYALAIDTAFVGHNAIGTDVTRLSDAFVETGKALLTIAPDRSAAGFDKEAGVLIDRIVAPAFRLAVESGRRAQIDIEQEVRRPVRTALYRG